MNQDSDAPHDGNDPALDRRLRAPPTPPPRTSAAHDDAVMRAMAASAHRIQRRRRKRWSLPVALAAMLVVGVGVGLNVMNNDAARGEILRGTPTMDVQPQNEARLAAAPESFAWTPATGVEAYSVVLSDLQGHTLWSSPAVTLPTVTLPAEIRKQLTDGGTYLWQIEARTANGRRVIGPYWFEVRR